MAPLWHPRRVSGSHDDSTNAPLAAQPGALIGGRYRLGDVLGKGGMGVVYRAAQESLARPVAIKLLIPALAEDGDAVQRFKAEAERAGRLAHPHIVQILDFGREPSGALWIAMELLEGESLAARIERAPLSEAEVVRIALETLAALEAAHGAQLVHRDLKPDNVFLSRVAGIGVSVKVLDFGIAKLLESGGAQKLTATGMLIGTPLYMAPEQARGLEVDTRADLYSLGALLYEALCQRPPLAATTYPALLVAVMMDEPRPITEVRPEISPVLAKVIHRAMAKDPAQRFQSAAEMAAALRTFQPSDTLPLRRADDASLALGNAPTMATPMPHTPPMGSAYTPPPERATEAAPQVAPRRSMTPVWIGALLLAALGGGAIALLLPPLLAPPPTPPIATAPVETATPMAPMAAPAPVAPAATIDVAPPSAIPSAIPSTIEEATPAAAPTEPAAPSDDEPARGTTHADRPRPPRGAGDAARDTTRRRYTPYIRYSGGSYAGMPRSFRENIDGAGDWSTCWPGDVPPPTSNRGRSYTLDVAGDGSITAVAPTTPLSAEPAAFASCVRRRLLAIRLPAPTAGEPIQIRVSFGID